MVIEAGRTTVNNGKRLRDPIFHEHSLDNVVWVCQLDRANDIHSWRDECFISNEPHWYCWKVVCHTGNLLIRRDANRYPCKEKRLASHHAQQCASRPSKRCIAFECGGHGCARPAAVNDMIFSCQRVPTADLEPGSTSKSLEVGVYHTTLGEGRVSCCGMQTAYACVTISSPRRLGDGTEMVRRSKRS